MEERPGSTLCSRILYKGVTPVRTTQGYHVKKTPTTITLTGVAVFKFRVKRSGRAPALGAGVRGFESLHPDIGVTGRLEAVILQMITRLKLFVRRFSGSVGRLPVGYHLG